jgi:serine/threonine protein kinase
MTRIHVLALSAMPLQIHQLNSTWSEARKASYVRHAVREYTIHKALHHKNIVSLTDIFEVRQRGSRLFLRSLYTRQCTTGTRCDGPPRICSYTKQMFVLVRHEIAGQVVLAT